MSISRVNGSSDGEDERIRREILGIIINRTQEYAPGTPEMRKKLDELEEDLSAAYESVLPPTKKFQLAIMNGNLLIINWVDK